MKPRFLESQPNLRHSSLDHEKPNPLRRIITSINTPQRATQLKEAAHLAGVSLRLIDPGMEINIHGNNIPVDKGHKGVVIDAFSPQNLEVLWIADKSLELASEAKKFNP